MAGFLERFRPGARVLRVTDIDPADLRTNGCELVILDLDNTLLPWKSSVIGDDVRDWVARAKAAGMKLVILSNTHHPGRLNRIASDLGVPSIAHAMKPRKKQFLKAAELAGCECHSAVVVGDQVMTDILGGNLAGMKTILVKPVHPHEFIGTKVSRLVERIILSRLSDVPCLGTNTEVIQSQTEDTK
jgi:HAD superfamily phosphatase (TIGR01668 family)